METSLKEFKTPKGTVLPLMFLKNKPYLQVAHRLIWFREERPDFSITTEVLDGYVKATIAGPLTSNNGQRPWVLATAHKTIPRDKQFPIELAETGAVGRALAYVGFGTQWALEIDEEDQLADAPIEPRKTQPGAIKTQNKPDSQLSKELAINAIPRKGTKIEPSPKVTQNQIDEMWAIAEHTGWTKNNVKLYFAPLGVNKSEEMNQLQFEYFIKMMRTHPKRDLERDAIENEDCD